MKDTRTLTINSRTKAEEIYKLLQFVREDITKYYEDSDDWHKCGEWLRETGMMLGDLAESHFVEEDEIVEHVSNCCGCPMDKDLSRCPDCKEGCGVEKVVG